MPGAFEKLKAVADLAKTAFGDDYRPDKEEISYLKTQLAEAVEEVIRDPALLKETIGSTRSAEDAINLVKGIIDQSGDPGSEEGSVYGRKDWKSSVRAIRSRMDGTVDMASKEASLRKKTDEISSLLHRAKDGSVTAGELAAALDGLVDEVLPSPDQEGLASGAVENIRSRIDQRADLIEKRAGELIEAAEEPSTGPLVPSWAKPWAPSWASAATAAFGATAIAAAAPEAAIGRKNAEKPLVEPKIHKKLEEILGRECSATRSTMELTYLAKSLRCASFGAVHVTCMDEAEAESRGRFLRSGVGQMLPRFDGANVGPVVTTNRGACYEPGSITIAAAHYAITDPLLLLVKIQPHCGIREESAKRIYGECARYGRFSHACGALRAVLTGDRSIPGISAVADTIDGALVAEVRNSPEEFRPLLMALVQVHAQAEHAIAECRALDRKAVYLFYGAISLNKPGEDSEVPVFWRVVDRRAAAEKTFDLGISGYPSNVRVEHERGKLRLI